MSSLCLISKLGDTLKKFSHTHRLQKQIEEFPRNGAFTSHVSKFAVFPCATTKDGSSASSKEVRTLTGVLILSGPK